MSTHKQTMDLEAFIAEAFPRRLPCNEAAQLCLRLYCSVDGLPSPLHAQCSKDGLADVFASLARRGFVTTAPVTAALYGANFHDVRDKGHWIEIIASIFKKGDTVDPSLGKVLVDRLVHPA